MKTYQLKPSKSVQNWLIVDAKGQTLGRLATQVATLLIGKHKPEYSPHVISGDVVVVINAGKIKVTGNKLEAKKYYRHSGYPGGLKTKSLEELLSTKPELVIKNAVARMLPKNKLQAKMLLNLKIYSDENHNHDAQKPIKYNLIGESK